MILESLSVGNRINHEHLLETRTFPEFMTSDLSRYDSFFIKIKRTQENFFTRGKCIVHGLFQLLIAKQKIILTRPYSRSLLSKYLVCHIKYFLDNFMENNFQQRLPKIRFM